jgi:hypothetical protein
LLHLGLHSRDVALADPAGATLRVRETWDDAGLIDLAGETFREEAELADARVFGALDQKPGQK